MNTGAAVLDLRLASNVGAKLGGRLIMVLTGAAAAALIGRGFGPAAFGLYAAGFAVASLGVFLFDPGVSGRLLPLLCSAPERARGALNESLAIVILLWPASLCVLCVGFVALVGISIDSIVLGASLGIWTGLGAVLAVVSSLLTARERLDIEFAATVVDRTIGLALIGLVLVLDGSLSLVFLALAGGRIAGIWLCRLMVRDLSISIRLPAPRNVARVLREGIPFWTHGVLTGLYILQGVLLLTLLTTLEEVGIFRAAATFHLQAPVLAIAASSSLFPRAVRRLRNDGTTALSGMVARAAGVLAIAGCATALLVIFFAPYAIELLYGNAFEAAVSPMQFLALAIPFLLVNNIVGMGLTVLGRQAERAKVSGVGALLGLVLGIVLIPAFGATGAAIQLLAVEIAVTTVLIGVYANAARSGAQASSMPEYGTAR